MSFQAKTLISTILVIACLAIGYFLVWPKWGEYQLSTEELVSVQQRKTQIEEAQQKLQSFLESFEQQQGRVDEMNLVLPIKDVAMHLVLNDLDRWARSSGVALADLAPVERNEALISASANTIQYQQLRLNASGSYPSLKNFVTLMESNQRLFDISDISIVSDVETPVMSIGVRVYFQK